MQADSPATAGAWDIIESRRRTSLTLAFLSIVAIYAVRWNGWAPAVEYSAAHTASCLVLGFNAWCWVLAILGYGRRYLNRPSRFLERLNEGIYPFFILHQTVIIAVGFYLIRVEGSVLAKFLFTSTVSLAVTWGLYEIFIRPVPAVRFMFGMKPRRRATLTLPATAGIPLPGTTDAYAFHGRTGSATDVSSSPRVPAVPEPVMNEEVR